MPNDALVSVGMIFLTAAESLQKAVEGALAQIQISDDGQMLLV